MDDDLNMDIGYAQYLDRKKDETRLYNCGGLPVELTLPEVKHIGMDDKVYCMYEYGNHLVTEFDRKN